MSFVSVRLARWTPICLLLLCMHCSGNMAGDSAGAAPQSTASGSMPGTAAAQPDPNAGDGNSSTSAGGTQPATSGSCASMPGPCSTTLTAITLTGCSSADYKAQVTLGGNQVFSMLIDTGSTTIAVADSSCTDCQDVVPQYSMDNSAQNIGTAVQSQYGTGNGWSGVAVSDTVQIASSIKPLTMRFARVTKQTATSSGEAFFAGSDCGGNITDNAEQGIFGLGNASDAVTGTDTYLDILKAGGQVADAFSFEACDSGGRLWLGGYDPASVTSAPVFTPLSTSQGYDLVTLAGLSVGGTAVKLASTDFGETLVDTGTSIFLLPNSAFDTLSQSIEANANYLSVFSRGFLASSEFMPSTTSAADLDASLPNLELTFPGVNNGADITVTLPASESYLTPFTYQGASGYLSGIAPVSSTPTTTILGNSTMHSHVLIFDRANQQLGYAPHGTCP